MMKQAVYAALFLSIIANALLFYKRSDRSEPAQVVETAQNGDRIDSAHASAGLQLNGRLGDESVIDIESLLQRDVTQGLPDYVSALREIGTSEPLTQ